MTDLARVHAVVTGRVQGVGFRSFIRRNAIIAGVNGWVRNRMDGSVEFVAEGERSTIEQFLLTVKNGNRFSHVQNLECMWKDAEGLKDFVIDY